MQIIENVLESFVWYSFNISYTGSTFFQSTLGFGCNLDHDGVTIYLHSLPDWDSQDKLFAFVENIQKAIEAAGVPINTPRQQTFHAYFMQRKYILMY